MSKELFWLSWTLAATALFSFPYVLNRVAIRGLWGTMSNPSSNDTPQSPWADRAQRAHVNAIENLVLFAPAAIAVSLLHVGNEATVFASQLYFFSRLFYYVIYLAGVPVLRTLAFFAGWVAIAILVYRLLTVV